jgi:hypothetical protein
MELSLVASLPGWSSIPGSIVLVGVGMRQVNLLVIAIDVYLTGFYLSEKALDSAKEWNSSVNRDCTSLAYALMPQIPPRNPARAKEQIRASVLLKFRRAITKTDFLTAFNTSMAGCDQAAIDNFLSTLGSCIDDENGVAYEEEVQFFWLEDLGFAVNKGGVYAGPIHIPSDLYLRLLEVYVDPSKSVAPLLSSCIHDHLNEIEFN